MLELEPSPMANPLNDYVIGSPRSATVYITPDGVTNLPPVVSIVEPTNGAAYEEPANIRLVAFASDPDGSVASVEFFAGSQSLGVVSNGSSWTPVHRTTAPGNASLSAGLE